MKTIMIQNQDRNMSARDYPDSTFLRVTSMFRTLQGEGPFAGFPAVFLRLSGCNYGSKTDMCTWCDTSFQFDHGQLHTIDQVVAELNHLEGRQPSDILVITGGEPTLQKTLLGLISKVWANKYFKTIQVETNGTQPKFFEDAEEMGLLGKDKVTFVVSPKANERLKKYPQVHPKVKWWADCYKFVLSAEEGDAHHEIPEWALTEKHKPVYVSPMTVYLKPYQGEVSSIWDADLVDQERTAANYAYAAAYALKHNLRLSVQMHTLTAIA